MNAVAGATAILRNIERSMTDDMGFRLEQAHEKLVRECAKRAKVDAPFVAIDPEAIPPRVEVLTAHGMLDSPLKTGLARQLEDPVALQRWVSSGNDPYQEPSAPGLTDAVLYGEKPRYFTTNLPRGGVLQRPISGCFGEATKALYGVDAEVFERTAIEVTKLSLIADDVAASQEVRDAVDRYSGCMRGAQLSGETPADVYSRELAPVLEKVLAGEEQPEVFGQTEDELAAVDARCKKESRLDVVFAEEFVAEARPRVKQAEGMRLRYADMIAHAKRVAGIG